VVKLVLNEPLSDEQFLLNQPPGSQLVRLGGAPPSPASTLLPSNSLQPGGDAEKRR